MSATNPRNQRYMAPVRVSCHRRCIRSPRMRFSSRSVGGVTADALTHDVDLKHIDIVDISKEAFALATTIAAPATRIHCVILVLLRLFRDGRFFCKPVRNATTIITGEPPPPKVLGSVNLYTEQFFSLMSDRLRDGGIATFWLPIYQLNVTEAKAIYSHFTTRFQTPSSGPVSDEEWIMMGIKGAPQKVGQ